LVASRDKKMKGGAVSISLRKVTGFTLIELMIVLAIVAITAAIALPSYQNQIEKTRRSAAKSDLVELASFMQRFYTENNRFDQDRGAVAIALPFNESPQDGAAKYYDLTLVVAQSSYTLKSTPKGTQSGDFCGTLSLAHTGAKTHSSGSDCW